MRNRVPNPEYVLDNGAIRYGIYDDAGYLLRYEYIKKEDDPSDEGTALNVANLLSDMTVTALAAALGFTPSADPTVDEMFAELAITPVSITYTSYVGDGTCGSSSPTTVYFAAAKIMFVAGDDRVAILVNADSNGVLIASAGTTYLQTTWYADHVKFYNLTNASNQMNKSGETYHVYVLN